MPALLSGMPFSWEGAAFFLEAIALGLFLYGWDKMPRWAHWGSGLVVGIAGVASGFFVICANAWMNSPAGFDWNNGHPINIDPWAAMFNDASFIQGLHMIVAAFEAVGFAVAGLHALLWLRTRHDLHHRALRIAFVFAALASIAQPLIGDFSAKSVARRQPIKLAAMEGLFETTKSAPLLIGGIPDPDRGKTDYSIELPGLLSFLAYGSFEAEVKGLQDFPREHWPPVLIVHLAFQLMVAIGSALASISALGLIALFKRPHWLQSKIAMRILILCAPLGFIALEAGWIVTEVGRQPWIIYGLLKTSEALTPRPGVVFTFFSYALFYGFLSLVVAFLLYRQTRLLHDDLQAQAAHGAR